MSVREIEAVYSKLFKLPSLNAVISLTLASCLILSISMDLSLNLSLTIHFSVFTLIALTSSFASSLLIAYSTRKSEYRILDFRRSTSLSMLSNFLTAILLIFFLAVGSLITVSWTEALIISLSMIFVFRLAIIYGLSEMAWFQTVLSSMLQPILLLGLIIPFIPFNSTHLLGLLLSVLIFGLIFHVFLRMINIEIDGTESIKLSRGFVADWILGNPRKLENELTKIAEERTLPVTTILFRSAETKERKALLVIPSIHPGPFKNVGSSNLPYLISTSVEKAANVETFVFHGASTHELDLTSREEIKKVVKGVLGSLKAKEFNRQLFHPLTERVDQFEISMLKFGDLFVSFISQLNSEVEDISFDVNMFLNSIYRGRESIAIVDLHNSIMEGGKPIRIGDKKSESLIKAILHMIEKTSRLKECELELGVSKQRELGISPLEGLGPDGISVLVLKTGQTAMVIVLLDSNNLIKGLREAIARRIQSYLSSRFKNVLVRVATTDTHVTVAISTEVGYTPLGKVTPHEKIINLILDNLNNALSNLEKVEFSYKSVNIPGLKVIGGRDEVLKFIVKESYEIMKNFLKYIVPLAVALNLIIMVAL